MSDADSLEPASGEVARIAEAFGVADASLTISGAGGKASITFHPDGRITAVYTDADEAARDLIKVFTDMCWRPLQPTDLANLVEAKRHVRALARFHIDNANWQSAADKARQFLVQTDPDYTGVSG